MIFNNVDFQLLLTQILHLNLKRVKIASNDMEYLDKVPGVKNQSVFKDAYDMGYSINTNQHTPFASIENEKLIVEICDSLSIGAAIENMILTATGYGLGTLWIANTCFAYNELMDFIGTDSQLTGIVAVGFADETPDKRPRKTFEEIVEYR